MNNSFAEKLKKQAANQLYKNRTQNLTQKELILKSYSKSAQYIELAIDFHESEQLSNYRTNVNNAILIIQNMDNSLNYYDHSGNVLEVAVNLHKSYSYLIKTLRDGLRENSVKEFDFCIQYLNELYFAFNSIK